MNAIQKEYLASYFRELFRVEDVTPLTNSVEQRPVEAFKEMTYKTIPRTPPQRGTNALVNCNVPQTSNISEVGNPEQEFRFDMHGFTRTMAPLYIRRVLMSFELFQTAKLKFVVGKGLHNNEKSQPILRNILLNLARIFGVECTENATNSGEVCIDLTPPANPPQKLHVYGRCYYAYFLVEKWKSEQWRVPVLWKQLTGTEAEGRRDNPV